MTTLEHLRESSTTAKNFAARLADDVAGTAAEAIEAVAGTADAALNTAANAEANAKALQKEANMLADDNKNVLAAMNLYMTTMQAEVRELKNLVATMQKQISALSS